MSAWLPCGSASIMRTRQPSAAQRAAWLALWVDFPTPPLFEYQITAEGITPAPPSTVLTTSHSPFVNTTVATQVRHVQLACARACLGTKRRRASDEPDHIRLRETTVVFHSRTSAVTTALPSRTRPATYTARSFHGPATTLPQLWLTVGSGVGPSQTCASTRLALQGPQKVGER